MALGPGNESSIQFDKQQAWSCFSHGIEIDTPVWHSYGDVLGVKYAYDSQVANSRRVTDGDLLIIRDNETVFGFGYIDFIRNELRPKLMNRCPACKKGGPEPRKTLRPRYHCTHCKANFDEPDRISVEVTASEAHYSDTWTPISLAASDLEGVYLSHSRQNAIRPLDLAGLRDLLRRKSSMSALESLAVGQPPKAVELPGGHRVTKVRVRKGQSGFRQELLRMHGNVCAISGPQPREALQAAHLYLYADSGKHDTAGGLLLRADLHLLFDNWRIAVDPSTWTVEVDPALYHFPHLHAFQGAKLQVSPSQAPNPEYLQEHLASARARWAEEPNPNGVS
ncbi:HNH endonuclease [Cryptosporangium aurantiacum]|uniref:HNH endonuclease n=1 Tax=Cryptosporangium aurantiacum TaxID=134849 RepID=A0A1M7NE75_9ACTN|nr:HNH endonuclease [Cryptosporangium aurantiacum]SHN02048.1 HNH endonuclease [Cryptosporangium aurantiacum]